MINKTHLTPISSNIKTGPIPVSTSSKKQCPPTCPFMANGCYAESGPVALHWKKVSEGERGLEWNDFLSSIKKLRKRTLWRHNQAGDLKPESKNSLKIDFDALKSLVEANKGRDGFTYTHYPVIVEDIRSNEIFSKMDLGLAREIVEHNRKCIKYANDNGFTVNISGNGPQHAQRLKALKIGPVVSVVTEDFKTDDEIVVCPATTRDDVTCASCGLCQKQHSKVIGFPAHGSRKKVAAKTLWK